MIDTTVAEMPVAVDTRRCPGCGLLIDQDLIIYSKTNYDCPKCGKFKQSEFKPIKIKPR
jgi:rubredoxin